MALQCGIVGLPNVGKSTLFNCLSNAKAQSANFPFCTIEPISTGSGERTKVIAPDAGAWMTRSAAKPAIGPGTPVLGRAAPS